MKRFIPGGIAPVTGILLAVLGITSGCQEEKVDVFATGVLDGTVMDFTSEEYLRGAILTTNPPTVSVATDSTGYFVFNAIDAGEYNLIARKNGYISESVNVIVKRDDTTSVVMLLERSSAYNDPPYFEDSFSPANGADNVPVNVTLSWQGGDPNSEDTLQYDVKVFMSNDQEFMSFEDVSDTTVNLEGLGYNTVYFWQVTVRDAQVSVQSELLNFRTLPLPDHPFRFARLTGAGDYEVFSSDSIPGTEVQLTRNSKDDWYPRLNYKGNRIAFISRVELEPHIFTMELDGSNISRVSQSPVTGYHNQGRGFAWSPFGDLIIYAHYDRIIQVNASSSSESMIAIAPEGRHFRDLDISPAGNRIVVQTVGAHADSSEIWLYNSNGSNPEVLVDNLPGIIESPTFSVEGNRVMYTRDVVENPLQGDRQLDTHIFIIDIGTRQTKDVSISKTPGSNDLNPRFSPDGAYIIFENRSNVPGSASSVWIMDSNGHNRRKLFDNAVMPDWR